MDANTCRTCGKPRALQSEWDRHDREKPDGNNHECDVGTCWCHDFCWHSCGGLCQPVDWLAVAERLAVRLLVYCHDDRGWLVRGYWYKTEAEAIRAVVMEAVEKVRRG